VIRISRGLADPFIWFARPAKCGSAGPLALKLSARANLMASPIAKVHHVRLAGYPGFHSRSVSI
jgi:hypothetical protein